MFVFFSVKYSSTFAITSPASPGWYSVVRFERPKEEVHLVRPSPPGCVSSVDCASFPLRVPWWLTRESWRSRCYQPIHVPSWFPRTASDRVPGGREPAPRWDWSDLLKCYKVGLKQYSIFDSRYRQSQTQNRVCFGGPIWIKYKENVVLRISFDTIKTWMMQS